MQLEFCKLSKPLISWQIVNTASIIIMMDRTGYKFVKFCFQKRQGLSCPIVKKKKKTTFCFFFNKRGPRVLSKIVSITGKKIVSIFSIKS